MSSVIQYILFNHPKGNFIARNFLGLIVNIEKLNDANLPELITSDTIEQNKNKLLHVLERVYLSRIFMQIYMLFSFNYNVDRLVPYLSVDDKIKGKDRDEKTIASEANKINFEKEAEKNIKYLYSVYSEFERKGYLVLDNPEKMRELFLPKFNYDKYQRKDNLGLYNRLGDLLAQFIPLQHDKNDFLELNISILAYNELPSFVQGIINRVQYEKRLRDITTECVQLRNIQSQFDGKIKIYQDMRVQWGKIAGFYSLDEFADKIIKRLKDNFLGKSILHETKNIIKNFLQAKKLVLVNENKARAFLFELTETIKGANISVKDLPNFLTVSLDRFLADLKLTLGTQDLMKDNEKGYFSSALKPLRVLTLLGGNKRPSGELSSGSSSGSETRNPNPQNSEASYENPILVRAAPYLSV